MQNKEELIAKLQLAGLEKYADQLAPFVRNSIRLHTQIIEEKNLAVGQTKIGGRPDLPPTIAWPKDAGGPEKVVKKFLFFGSKKNQQTEKSLAFIAQLNLSEVASFDVDNLLPQEGMLYFFYSADQEVWGFDPKDREGFKVMYYPGNLDELARTEYPADLPEYARYAACGIEMESEINLPMEDTNAYDGIHEDEQDLIWEQMNPDETTNKIFGYANNIQGEMELECELVTHGLYCGDATGYNSPQAKALEPNAKNWLLLLQIDTNDEIDMMWGDTGRIYFWIKKEDLINQRFDKAWFCLQCY
jgi:uncharacterized protein YwqG